MNIAGPVVLVVVALLAACRDQRPLDPSDPSATCESACGRASSLGCSGFTTPRGTSCVEVCGNAHREAAVEWPVGCMTRALSCDALRACR